MKQRNFVAKHAQQFCIPKVEQDRTKYTRKTKHKQNRLVD
jgi:hypothetical protein